MMQIKKVLKKTFIGKIKNRINRKSYSNDYIKKYRMQYNKYSSTDVDEDDPDYLKLRILIVSHMIEKGLSHKEYRAGFGREAVTNLVMMVRKYAQVNNSDSFVLQNAYDLLLQYHTCNLQCGFDDSDFVPKDVWGKGKTNVNVGAKTICLSDVLNIVNSAKFEEFAKARVSVRVYDKPARQIEDNILEKCVEVAQSAPSACNRQATHVYIVKRKDLFEEIEKLQLGCKGFGINASAFVFVTSDLRLYECAEMKLPVFDAGLFTMNLVYAFHSEGICSCVLNASFPNDKNDSIKELVGIPKHEMINGLLVVYQLDAEEELKVPVSPRRKISDICKIIG